MVYFNELYTRVAYILNEGIVQEAACESKNFYFD